MGITAVFQEGENDIGDNPFMIVIFVKHDLIWSGDLTLDERERKSTRSDGARRLVGFEIESEMILASTGASKRNFDELTLENSKSVVAENNRARTESGKRLSVGGFSALDEDAGIVSAGKRGSLGIDLTARSGSELTAFELSGRETGRVGRRCLAHGAGRRYDFGYGVSWSAI